MNEKLEKAFCVQINKELYSAYLYLAMQAYFKEINLDGFANWMYVQVQEELAHAMGMYNYVFERGGKVELMSIEKPEYSFNSPLNVFEEVLKHEKYVTSLINDLAFVAEEVRDRAAMSLLDWYIKEQVEEEANVSNVLGNLKLAQNDPRALLLLDRAAMSLLDWYIKEQVEEEANVSNVLGNLKLAQNDPRALLLLDRELATRTFVAPVIG